MPDQVPPTIKSLFIECMRRDNPQAQQEFLEEACGDDQAVRDEVLSLLSAHGSQDSFLEHSFDAASATAAMPAVAHPPGTVIGPYKLREQIGEGGFGIVYVAEQSRPVQRKVALKLIKPGMDTRDVIARFEAERQALALMDHPNIAKVLDAGTTGEKEEGGRWKEEQEAGGAEGSAFSLPPSALAASRPFFVMELVRGIPITEYCNRHKLTMDERLKLFVTVCRAVQHAHMKGVIHRDIKPSNILVTQIDGNGVPKVIDFGVAKAISQRLTERTIYTQFAQMIGTPAYMSPEQAEMSGVDIDTRTDVYSLGVLLYQLLTGSTPFDREVLKQASFDEFRRIIREDEPPRPSMRISTFKADALSTLSQQRGSEPGKLSQALRGELDWIVMQALDKDRNRRYESASAFAADIERYLNDEPVQACPPSLKYRVGKYARRHKGLLTTAALVLLTMLAGTGLASYQARQAIESRNLANERQEQSDANYRRALDAIDRMLHQVGGKTLFEVPGMLPIQRQLLEDAVEFYEELMIENPDDPHVRYHAAATYLSLAAVNGNLRTRDHNLEYCSRSVELLEHICETHPERIDYAAKLADAFWWLANATLSNRDAEVIYRRGIQVAETVAEKDPQSAYLLSKLCLVLGSRLQTIEPEEAQRLLMRAVDAAKGSGRMVYVGEAQSGLAQFLADRGQPEESIPEYRSAISTFQQVLNEDPGIQTSRNTRYWMSDARRNLGEVFVETGQFELAEEEFRLALDRAADLSQDFPEVEKYRTQTSSVVSTFTLLLEDLGCAEEAQALLLELASQSAPRSAGEYVRRAELYAQAAEPDLALADYEMAIRRDPENVDAFRARGMHFFEIEQFEFALEDFGRALELQPGVASIWVRHGDAATQLGDTETAFRDYTTAIELQPNWSYYKRRGEAYDAMGDHENAIRDYTSAIDLEPIAYIYKRRCAACFKLDEYAAALADLTAAVELNPHDASNLYWIAPDEVASCPDAAFRDGMLDLADKAVIAVDTPSVRSGRAALLTAFGEWDRAREDFAVIIADESARYYSIYQGALLALETDDREFYRELCQMMLVRFGDSDDPAAAEFTAWTCALAPDAIEEYTLSIRLAHAVANSDRENLVCLGAVLMRAGEHGEAKATLEEALQADNSGSTSKSYARYFLAMTEHHLGNDDAAQTQLEAANESAEAELADSPGWNRRLTLELLREEAEALLNVADDGSID